MFQIRTLTEKVEIPFRCLCKNWKDEFFNILRQKKDRTVDPREGAILKVDRLISSSNPIVHNSKMFSEIKYDAISFKPSIGELYSGEITIITQLGLLVEAEGLVKVMIQPRNMPEGYKFDPVKKIFSNGIQSYSNGMIITFKIVGLMYKPTVIQCIGTVIGITQTSMKEKNEVIEEDTILEPVEEFD